jgi:hypothetical protein
MDAQTLVLDRYPDAEAVAEPPVFRHGDTEPIDSGFWGIHIDSGAIALGEGATEHAAWADAAHKLTTSGRRDDPRPASRKRVRSDYLRLKRM